MPKRLILIRHFRCKYQFAYLIIPLHVSEICLLCSCVSVCYIRSFCYVTFASEILTVTCSRINIPWFVLASVRFTFIHSSSCKPIFFTHSLIARALVTSFSPNIKCTCIMYIYTIYSSAQFLNLVLN